MERHTTTEASSGAVDRRAQTTLDFAIAMGVFLLAIAFVFSFVPTFVAPFVDGGQEHSAASDRTASHLAEGAFADPNEPQIVHEECMTPFFAGLNETEIPDSCGYEGNDTRAHLGVSNRSEVEVRMERVGDDSAELLCSPDDADEVVLANHEDCDEDGVEYSNSTSGVASEDVSTTVARRTVTVDGDDCGFEDDGACDVTMYVEVW